MQGGDDDVLALNTWDRSGGGFSKVFAAPDHQSDAVRAYVAQTSLPTACDYDASNRAYLEIDGSIYAHWLEADSSVWRRRDLAGACP